jgi:hypothetical protein
MNIEVNYPCMQQWVPEPLPGLPMNEKCQAQLLSGLQFHRMRCALLGTVQQQQRLYKNKKVNSDGIK